MQRRMYRAWSPDAHAAKTYFSELNNGQKELRSAMRRAAVERIGVFGGDGHWFAYVERSDEAAAGEACPGTDSNTSADLVPLSGAEPIAESLFDLGALFPGAQSVLSPWPGRAEPGPFAPMADIFHYRRPADGEPWRQGGLREGYGRLARLRPERIAGYVFYHYQYQEEKPGDGNKYGIIGLHENLLFFYAERPVLVEPAPYAGTLDTSRTPEDWEAVMRPHFIEWEDAPENETIWHGLDRVLEARLPEREED